MRLPRWFPVLLCVLWPMAAHADEVFPDVQYISGHAGMDKKAKGTLTLTDKELRFAPKDNAPGAFALPLTTVKDATNSVEQNPGSTGAKLMLGVFASKKEEFLYVNTETQDGAEALVFKTKNKTSPAMVAKIKFALKRAAEPAPAATTEATPATQTGGAAPAAPAAAAASSTAPADSVPAAK